MSIPCLLCARPGGRIFTREGAFTWVRCDSCGTAWVEPRPDEAALARMYQCETGATFHRAAEMVETFEKDFEARLRYRLVRGLLRPPVLEIGCGAGYFVRHLKRAGLTASGVELSDALVEFGRTRLGVDIRRASLDELSGRYGSIVLFNVLSHLTDPLRDLARLRGLLEPGGTIILETGNMGEVDPGRVPKLGAPDHLYHFTRSGVRTLLERSGFSVRQMDVFDVTLQWRLLAAMGRARASVSADGSAVAVPRQGRPFRRFLKEAAIVALLRLRYLRRAPEGVAGTIIAGGVTSPARSTR